MPPKAKKSAPTASNRRDADKEHSQSRSVSYPTFHPDEELNLVPIAAAQQSVLRERISVASAATGDRHEPALPVLPAIGTQSNASLLSEIFSLPNPPQQEDEEEEAQQESIPGLSSQLSLSPDQPQLAAEENSLVSPPPPLATNAPPFVPLAVPRLSWGQSVWDAVFNRNVLVETINAVGQAAGYTSTLLQPNIGNITRSISFASSSLLIGAALKLKVDTILEDDAVRSQRIKGLQGTARNLFGLSNGLPLEQRGYINDKLQDRGHYTKVGISLMAAASFELLGLVTYGLGDARGIDTDNSVIFALVSLNFIQRGLVGISKSVAESSKISHASDVRELETIISNLNDYQVPVGENAGELRSQLSL